MISCSIAIYCTTTEWLGPEFQDLTTLQSTLRPDTRTTHLSLPFLLIAFRSVSSAEFARSDEVRLKICLVRHQTRLHLLSAIWCSKWFQEWIAKLQWQCKIIDSHWLSADFEQVTVKSQLESLGSALHLDLLHLTSLPSCKVNAIRADEDEYKNHLGHGIVTLFYRSNSNFWSQTPYPEERKKKKKGKSIHHDL